VIEPRYRRDYQGEYVITTTNWREGKKSQAKEWIPNAIVNQHLSGRAAVIGSNNDRERFDHTRLQRHRGGLQGKKRLQTYGTRDIWRDMRLDFYVSTDQIQLNKIVDLNYQESTAVFTTARHCLRCPGKFYLIPFTPPICDAAMPIYLSVFDGHQEIFLLGYDREAQFGKSTNWINDVDQIIKAYESCDFILVGTESNMPDLLRHNKNVSCINHRSFITRCDI